eukprot:768590-Hanusia_phi.AAC.13
MAIAFASHLILTNLPFHNHPDSMKPPRRVVQAHNTLSGLKRIHRQRQSYLILSFGIPNCVGESKNSCTIKPDGGLNECAITLSTHLYYLAPAASGHGCCCVGSC